jgi:hypothetical protein
MRNPFPGMNPYLEDPTLWGGVHHLLMSALHQQLNQRLPEGYVALVEERIYLETSDAFQHYVPDVLVARRREATSDTPAPTAVADPPVRIELHDPMTEPFLQIFSVRNKQRLLVAVIEVLSPANKTPNAEGRRRYLQKQRDLLHSTVHLLEIDLLHYCLLYTSPWFVRLIERLPRVSVPLLPADPEVVIDLQAAIDSVYEQGRYHELLDYSVEPPIPLTDEQRNWVRQHLQAQGVQ